jgi:hypothetical protein
MTPRSPIYGLGRAQLLEKGAEDHMTTTGTLFNEWRTADREAHKLERALTLASLQALDGHGAVPSDDEHQAARRLRQQPTICFSLRWMNLRYARASRSGHPAQPGAC